MVNQSLQLGKHSVANSFGCYLFPVSNVIYSRILLQTILLYPNALRVGGRNLHINRACHICYMKSLYLSEITY